MSETVVTDTSCRLCLESDDNLMNVFDIPDLDKLIYQCVFVKIVPSDPLPTGVCFKCIGEVQNWTKFKKTCDHSQEILLKSTKKSTMPSSITTIHNIMNDSIEVDLSVFDHESLLDNLEKEDKASTNQSIVSLIPCHSTPLPEFISHNSIVSPLIPCNEKEDLDFFKPIKRELEVIEESSCEVSQEEKSQIEEEEEYLNGTFLSYADSLDKGETSIKKTLPCDKTVFKKPLYVKSIERCYQGMKQHDGKERFPAKYRAYKCDLCSKSFTSFKSLSYHDQLEHKSILESQGVTCHQCTQVFLDKCRLETHILMQHSTRSVDYTCPICTKCYVSKRSLNSHMTSHSDKHKCHQCDQRFTSASLRSAHIDRTHNKIKRHRCNICEKKFYSVAEVNRHQRCVHLNIKNFRCQQCNLELQTRSALDNHMRSVHSDEKAIVCEHCGERFKTQTQRWYHFKKNHDEFVTMFSCPICQEMFTTKVGYRIHVRTHRPSQNICCFYCGNAFKCKRNLIQHIARIHNKPNQTCDLCGMKFYKKHNCVALLNPDTPIVSQKSTGKRSKYALASRYGSNSKSVVDNPTSDYVGLKSPQTGEKKAEKNTGRNMSYWKCNLCDSDYSRKSNLKRHMMNSHSEASKKPKLADSVDTQEEIMNTTECHVLENRVKVQGLEPKEAVIDAQDSRTVEIINTTGWPVIELQHNQNNNVELLQIQSEENQTSSLELSNKTQNMEDVENCLHTVENEMSEKSRGKSFSSEQIENSVSYKCSLTTHVSKHGLEPNKAKEVVDTKEPQVVDKINTTESPVTVLLLQDQNEEIQKSFLVSTTSVTSCPPTTSVTSCPPTTSVTSCPPTKSVTSCPPTTSVTSCRPTKSVTSCPPTKSVTPCPPTTSVTSCPPTTSVTSCPPTTSVTSCPPTTSGTSSPIISLSSLLEVRESQETQNLDCMSSKSFDTQQNQVLPPDTRTPLPTDQNRVLEENLFPCDLCGKHFALKRNLDRHKVTIHRLSKKSTNNQNALYEQKSQSLSQSHIVQKLGNKTIIYF
ncbi:hypothetical protein WDU94_011918 [Cyamophila willieti]